MDAPTPITQPGHTSTGCLAPDFDYSVYEAREYIPQSRVSSTNGYPVLPIPNFIPLGETKSEYLKMLNDATLVGFLDLNENWNGYGASKFDIELINVTRDVLAPLNFLPSIFPTGRKSIQLEFEKANGDYLEFEIFGEDNITMLMIMGESEIEKSITNTEVKSYLQRFYA